LSLVTIANTHTDCIEILESVIVVKFLYGQVDWLY